MMTDRICNTLEAVSPTKMQEHSSYGLNPDEDNIKTNCDYLNCEQEGQYVCHFHYDSQVNGCKRKVCKKHINSNLYWICNDCDRKVFKKSLWFTVKWCALITVFLVITYVILLVAIN